MKKCTKCGTAVAPTAKFCGECGAKIERKKYCPECGTEVKPEQKFCTECGTSLSIPTPKTESKPSETVTVKNEIQTICDKIKTRLEELGMTEFILFTSDYDGRINHSGEPILPEDIDVEDIFLDLDWETYGCFWRQYIDDDNDAYELIRRIKIVDNQLLFDIYYYEPGSSINYSPETGWLKEHYIKHENCTLDEIMDIYEEDMIECHIKGVLREMQDDGYYDTLKLNKMIAQSKADEKTKKKSESKTSKKEEKQSKKKSEPKPDKELDKKLNDLYKMGVACQLGKKGVEQDIMLAMDYYQEYLDKAPTSHSKYLDAHYGMAKLCTDMGDQGHSLGMDDDAMDWYNDAVEHYEEILVKYPKKAFNDRLLAEVAYDKLHKKIAKLK
jgi:hypothetical protein